MTTATPRKGDLVTLHGLWNDYDGTVNAKWARRGIPEYSLQVIYTRVLRVTAWGKKVARFEDAKTGEAYGAAHYIEGGMFRNMSVGTEPNQAIIERLASEHSTARKRSVTNSADFPSANPATIERRRIQAEAAATDGLWASATYSDIVEAQHNGVLLPLVAKRDEATVEVATTDLVEEITGHKSNMDFAPYDPDKHQQSQDRTLRIDGVKWAEGSMEQAKGRTVRRSYAVRLTATRRGAPSVRSLASTPTAPVTFNTSDKAERYAAQHRCCDGIEGAVVVDAATEQPPIHDLERYVGAQARWDQSVFGAASRHGITVTSAVVGNGIVRLHGTDENDQGYEIPADSCFDIVLVPAGHQAKA